MQLETDDVIVEKPKKKYLYEEGVEGHDNFLSVKENFVFVGKSPLLGQV